MPLRIRLKAEDRRKQLLGIAKKLFARYGFENTTTKAIAAEAGVSEAIIFRHFASKEELYASILDRKADEIGIRTWGAELSASAAKADDEALVFSVVKHILDADREDPEFRKVMLQAALSGHPLHKLTANRLSPLHRFLSRYIIKRQKQGAFQDCDPKLAANAIIGVPSYFGLSKILFDVDDVRLPEEQKAWSITRLILEGLRFRGKPLPEKRPSKTPIKARKA
jgi:TetR/AcrR family transcriptional regulator